MARPNKRKVSYFPHDTDASEGKTLTIIQNKFGNDGYAFWFKLLQLLGKTPGHYYDYNNPADWEFLLAKTHQNDTLTVKAILETLAALRAIDPELHAKNIIWCQNFVDGIADAYSRTKKGVPKKPNLDNITTVLENPENWVNVDNSEVNVGNTEFLYTETPKNITKTPQREKEREKKSIKEPTFSLKEKTLEIAETLRGKYPNLDFDHQMEKFMAYWFEGGRKLKNPKLAIMNWMDKASEFKKPVKSTWGVV